MVVIGIVGGIASGKSFVSGVFREFGAQVIDADRIGHGVLEEPAVKRHLCQRWGAKILNPQGTVDRRAIASLVFGTDQASQENLAELERLTHPLISHEITRQLTELRDRSPSAVVVLDAAVMIETGWHQFCDRLVFVDASLEQRLEFAKQRGWSVEEFHRREARQSPLDHKRELADAVIVNSGQALEVRQQVRKLLQEWNLLGA